MFRRAKQALGIATGVFAIVVTVLWDASRRLAEDDADASYEAERQAARERRKRMVQQDRNQDKSLS